MNTALHSFIDIFDTEFGEDKDAVKLQKIVIPIIQRDYAQGRTDPGVNRVRSRFLDSLYTAVTEKPITLDFVYGDIDEKGVMTPLDGQQRLTTLFLLHWYAARKNNIPAEEMAFLKHFSYETRYSARSFCEDLIKHVPTFKTALSKEIINQAWFPLEWKKDPTISSMLVMLDAIDEKFSDVPDLWDKLKNNAITFYFLPIKDMGLTDELYIKMNSRGKPLTQFEHFKAELERQIRLVDENLAADIIKKIDCKWTDLLWSYRSKESCDNKDPTKGPVKDPAENPAKDATKKSDEDVITDDEFLRYFKFVCDIICYKKGESQQSKSDDEFDLLQRYFSPGSDEFMQNIKTLESFFDCWCDIPGYTDPKTFLESFMSDVHTTGKIIVDVKHYKIDIFEDCLHSYSDKSGNHRAFPLNRTVLLYAIIVYLQNTSSIASDQFVRRIRIINNLIQNSEDDVSDRTDRNQIPAILREVDAIMLTGKIDDTIERNFNTNQLAEEKEKIAFLESHPDKAEAIFKLEDHAMLYGQIGIVGLEHIDYVDRFYSLFACELDKIDCALMSIGDYGQREKNKWRYQYASKHMQYAWNGLFHKSANAGLDNTKQILIKLLDSHETFTDSTLRAMIDDFVSTCEKNSVYPWRYYYVKYPVFRPGSYGKLVNSHADESPYLFSVLQTRSQWSSNTYMPYLKAADDEHLSKDSMGQRLVYGDKHIICTNDAYLLRNNTDEAVINTVKIAQDSSGIDIEDRIERLKTYIATL